MRRNLKVTMPRANRKRQRGAEIVEFLIVLPAILIVLFMIVELGVAFIDQAVLTNGTRAAAREVIRGKRDPAPQNAAEDILASLMVLKGPKNLNISSDCADPDDPEPPEVCLTIVPEDYGDRGVGDEVTVTLTYNYQFFLLPAFATIPAFRTLTAATTMRMLQPVEPPS